MDSGDGNVEANLSANRPILSCRKRELVFSSDICWVAVATTSGWLWPTRNSTIRILTPWDCTFMEKCILVKIHHFTTMMQTTRLQSFMESTLYLITIKHQLDSSRNSV